MFPKIENLLLLAADSESFSPQDDSLSKLLAKHMVSSDELYEEDLEILMAAAAEQRFLAQHKHKQEETK